MGEGDGEGRVGGEVELGVSFAPVEKKNQFLLDDGDVHRCCCTGSIDPLVFSHAFFSPSLLELILCVGIGQWQDSQIL